MVTEKRPKENIDDDELNEAEAELTPEEFEELKQTLLGKRAEVIVLLEKHVREAVGDSVNLPDEMDLASQQSERGFLLRMADKKKKLLGEIDRALRKFDEGEYGFCEGTGEPIGIRRLRIRPWTRWSIEYKEELEKKKKAGKH